MKMTAAAAVILANRLAGPREPKTEVEEPPPKAEPSPELLLVCNKTLIINMTATTTWTTVTAFSIKVLCMRDYSFKRD
jgi:hypothetical protein